MSYRIQGNDIINDSRAIIGVSTAGINDALYVGDVRIQDGQIQSNGAGVVTFIGDGGQLTGVLKDDGSNIPDDLAVVNVVASGYVSVAQTLTATGTAKFGTSIQFGEAPTTIITGFSTDGVDMGGAGTASDALLPTEKAVRDYVGAAIAGGVTLGVEGDTGTAELSLDTEDLVIKGTANEIETAIVGSELIVGLPDIVAISSDLSVGRNLAVSQSTNLTNTTIGAGATLFAQNIELSGTKIDTIGITTALGTSDTTIPTQKAVKEYVDSQVGGNANLRVRDNASGITTISLSSEELTFAPKANETTVAVANDTVTLGISSELVVGQSLTVNTQDLVVTDSLVRTVQPVFLDGSSASGVGLTVTNAIQAGIVSVTNDVKAGSITLGSTTIIEFSNDDTLGDTAAATNIIPTQKAVKEYVDSQTGDVSTLNFTGSANGDIGSVEINGEEFAITGTSNEIVTRVNAPGDPGLTVGFADTVRFPNGVSFGSTIFVTSDATLNSDLNVAQTLRVAGAGIAVSVSNSAQIGGTLNIDTIQALGSAPNFSIDGGGNAITLTNGNVVADSGLTANAQISAEGAGIGLTVANNAYITGDLTVDGTLLAAGGVDFDDIIVKSIQAEGPGPLVMNGTTPGSTEVGIAFTNGPVSMEDALTLRDNLTMEGTGDLLVQGGSATIGGQLVANGAGIGLTVDNNAYISGTLQVDSKATFDTTAGFAFGAGQVVNEIVTDVTAGTNNQLPTAQAVRTFIGGVASGIALTFTDGTTDGEILTATETLGLLGTPDQIVTNIVGAGDNDITFSLPNTLVAPGSFKATTTIEAVDTLIAAKTGIGLSVVGQSTFGGDATFGAGSTPEFQGGLRVTAGIATIGELKLGVDPQSVTGINTSDTLTGATDSQLASAAAIKQYVDDAAGSVSNITLSDAGNTDDTFYVSFASTSFGAASLETDADQLTYNPNSGILQAQEFNALSDIRYKENVQLIADPLAKLEGLRGVTFDWKDAPGRSAGLIAQELQQVMPDLVTESPEKLTVNYNGVIGLLVEAVKELQARVEELEAGN